MNVKTWDTHFREPALICMADAEPAAQQEGMICAEPFRQGVFCNGIPLLKCSLDAGAGDGVDKYSGPLGKTGAGDTGLV